MRGVRGWVPVVTLAFLAAVVAELVGSNNTPTIAFFNPLVALLLMALYGPAALLLREAWVRDRIGWPGVLAVGAAYCALNEGVVAATWFRDDFGTFSTEALGRAGGVNWNLIVTLTVFHTFVSLVVPVVLAGLTFPDRATRPWLQRRGVLVCAGLIAFVGITSALSDQNLDEAPEVAERERLVALAVALALVGLAAVLPRWRPPVTDRAVWAPARLLALGIAWSVAYFLLFFVLPRALPAAVIPVTVAFEVATVALVVRVVGSRRWTPRHSLALVTGVLVPSMLGSLVRIATLQPLSTVAFLVYLRWLRGRIAVTPEGSSRPPRTTPP